MMYHLLHRSGNAAGIRWWIDFQSTALNWATSHVERSFIAVAMTCALLATCAEAGDRVALFDGTSLDQWELRKDAWEIAGDRSLTCRFQQVKQKSGVVRRKSMGYIWSKKNYGNFRLRLSYRLSPGANSGVFFRTNPADPVQAGFEIQLLEESQFKGKLRATNRNGALYDAQASRLHPQKPIGEWNHLMLECIGEEIRVTINGLVVNIVDISQWDQPGFNPNGTKNKFRRALSELPRQGRIGFQNHGNPVWFRDVSIEEL